MYEFRRNQVIISLRNDIVNKQYRMLRNKRILKQVLVIVALLALYMI